MMNQNTQSGRSMVEVMGYMVVVMLLAAGLGKIVAGAYGEYKFSKASLQLSDYAVAITKAAAIDATYEDVIQKINSGDSEAKKLLPSSYRVNSNKVRHAFGGEVTVGTYDADKFYITFSGLEKDQCIELAMKDWINNRIVDLYTIKVNDDIWYWPIYHAGDNALPITYAKVAGTTDDNGQCTDGDENSIMWVFN
ncbi:MAG: hypothetical protein IKN67_04715 [Alphaproteobacteria bacterium]|nr:hypothetical protein [Alphaproteobacteria bacterium]